MKNNNNKKSKCHNKDKKPPYETEYSRFAHPTINCKNTLALILACSGEGCPPF